MKNQKGVSLITLIITIIVVIILAVIVLRSGASDTPDQAAFSGFTQEMGELQDSVTAAMLEVKGKEQLAGNPRSEAQIYNFIARGGYEGFSGEREKANNTIPNDAKWLTQAHANNTYCTLINKEYAEDMLGRKLPVRKVETALGVEQEMSYFVTPEGTVFCWPPYVYNGKTYVNANDTVKDSNGDEIGDLSATEDSKVRVNIIVGNKEHVNNIINSKDGYIGVEKPPYGEFGFFVRELDAIYYTAEKQTYKDRGAANGISYENYDNITKGF